jgi:DNA processing protein
VTAGLPCSGPTAPSVPAPSRQAAGPGDLAGAPSADVAAAALVAVRGMGLEHRAALLDRWPDPRDALAAVRSGAAAAVLGERCRSGAQLVERWRAQLDPAAVARVLAARGTRVMYAGAPTFPCETELEHGPVVLLAEGDAPAVLDRPRVAIVGSRAATPQGLHDAHALGRFLADRGVVVVSGLAIGIDASAHEGALATGSPAATIGVVATGLDVVYPRRHQVLTASVRRRGLVVGEQWFGVPASRHLFPVRNRIIAALADVVVVVEAAARGGALHTARWALDYDRPLLVPPGSRRNPVAEGTNQLLREGAHPLLEPSDVLEALALTAGSRRGAGPTPAPIPADPAHLPGPGGWRPDPAPPLSTGAAAVLLACGGEPATVDQLAVRTGLGLGPVARAVAELERTGRMVRQRGWLWPC